MERSIIASRAGTSRLLRRFQLRAAKRLGQNFLIDYGIVEKIVAAAELAPGELVLEVGPGLGALTQGLAERGAQVLAVELDPKLLPVLQYSLAGYGNVELVQGDVLALDLGALTGGRPFKVCANLPYYITTPLLFAFLEQDLPVERLVVMVQKEVAQRLTAGPGSRAYGALSVACQYYTQPELAFTVAADCFLPSPQVESAVLVCRKRPQPAVAVADEARFFQVVKAAFATRRKMLANSLRNLGLDGAACAQLLAAAGIEGQRRAESLSLADFAALADSYTAIRQEQT